ERGVEPDTLVGLCVERSVEMVIGLLGIIKAGGAYVPIDPDYPSSRIAYMLQDASLGTVLTHSSLLERTGISQSQALLFDDESVQDRLAGQSTRNLPVQGLGLTSSHLAYVIYTSGSTGTPKGVMVEHSPLHNRIRWMQDEYCLCNVDTVLQKTPFSFDVSVWEFFWPLAQGAKLLVARPGGHKDPDYLCDLIVKEGVTRLHFVPSMLKVILDSNRWEECHSVRHVYCSGEALPSAVVNQFYKASNKSELFNLYGPTEAAIDVSHWHCRRHLGREKVLIGRPISNIKLYVLDEQRLLVPHGCPGELYIGGAGLARGYLNREDLTSQVFTSNPYREADDGADARLYKTGDLVRWTDQGELEYLGRLDHQVKIR
ncbi:amino acid adenylation domain-containing protein, partial [Gilvimarinus sp. SDUM040013]